MIDAFASGGLAGRGRELLDDVFGVEFGAGENGQQKDCKDGNDGHDDQQFNQSECSPRQTHPVSRHGYRVEIQTLSHNTPEARREQSLRQGGKFVLQIAMS